MTYGTLRVPYLTVTLIAALVVTHLLTTRLEGPSALRLGFNLDHPSLIGSFAYIFVHDDAWHLLQNSSILLFFGFFVEARSRLQLVLVFFAAGVAAAYSQLITHFVLGMPESSVLVGASGAISGLAGWAAVTGLRMPSPGFGVRLMRTVALGWLALQAMLAVISAGSEEPTSVAHWAHLFGFFVGAVAGVFSGDREKELVEAAGLLLKQGKATLALGLLTRRPLGSPRALLLAAEAWATLGDREKAAEYCLLALEKDAVKESIRTLIRLDEAARLPPEIRLKEAGSDILQPSEKVALLRTFVHEPIETHGRGSALLRLADMVKGTDTEEARALLSKVVSDYPGSEEADLATLRLKDLET